MTPLLIIVLGIHPVVAVGTDLTYGAITKTLGGYRPLLQEQARMNTAGGNPVIRMLGDLAVYLGGSEDSFTGLLLRLTRFRSTRTAQLEAPASSLFPVSTGTQATA